jgi:hypothetical protein
MGSGPDVKEATNPALRVVDSPVTVTQHLPHSVATRAVRTRDHIAPACETTAASVQPEGAQKGPRHCKVAGGVRRALVPEVVMMVSSSTQTLPSRSTGANAGSDQRRVSVLRRSPCFGQPLPPGERDDAHGEKQTRAEAACDPGGGRCSTGSQLNESDQGLCASVGGSRFSCIPSTSAGGEC